MTTAEIDRMLTSIALMHKVDNAEHVRRGATARKTEFLTVLQEAADTLLERRLTLTKGMI